MAGGGGYYLVFLSDVCALVEGSFGVSRVAGFANFRPRVSSSTFKLCGFSDFETCRELRVWPFFVLGFGYFTKNSCFVGFSKLYTAFECFKRGAGSL